MVDVQQHQGERGIVIGQPVPRLAVERDRVFQSGQAVGLCHFLQPFDPLAGGRHVQFQRLPRAVRLEHQRDGAGQSAGGPRVQDILGHGQTHQPDHPALHIVQQLDLARWVVRAPARFYTGGTDRKIRPVAGPGQGPFGQTVQMDGMGVVTDGEDGFVVQSEMLRIGADQKGHGTREVHHAIRDAMHGGREIRTDRHARPIEGGQYRLVHDDLRGSRDQDRTTASMR